MIIKKIPSALQFILNRARYISRKYLSMFKISIITALHGPSCIAKTINSQDIRLLKIEKSSNKYYIAIIKKGLIFTNRNNNISIISNKKLVPFVSWQWHDHVLRIVQDSQNDLLTKQLRLTQAPKYINSVIVSLLTGAPGNDNYYHWFFDCLSRLCLTETVTKSYQNIKYLIPDDIFPYQKESLAQLGINSSNYISSRDAPFIQSKLLIASSYPNPEINDPAEWCIDFIRKSFLPLALQTNTENQLIYISRSDSIRSRRLTNESYLLSLLVPLGFRVVHLSTINFNDQVTLFANAKMVVGVHGAGLTNLIFSKPGTIVCEIFGETYQPVMFKKISNYLDFRYNAYFSAPLEASGKLVEDANEMWKYTHNIADITISEKDVNDIVSITKNWLYSLKAPQ